MGASTWRDTMHYHHFMQYIIVAEDNIATLQRSVQRKLNEGHIPLGGIATTTVVASGNTRIGFYQAMRYDDPIRTSEPMRMPELLRRPIPSNIRNPVRSTAQEAWGETAMAVEHRAISMAQSPTLSVPR
jgi:hypothetical protein